MIPPWIILITLAGLLVFLFSFILWQKRKERVFLHRGMDLALFLVTLPQQAVSEKEIQWEAKEKEAEEIRDVCGEKVDEGVNETAIALNLLGLPTSASCEGHLEKELVLLE